MFLFETRFDPLSATSKRVFSSYCCHLEAEAVCHSLGEIVFGRGGVDFNRVQVESRCLLAQHLREHAIAFEQVL